MVHKVYLKDNIVSLYYDDKTLGDKTGIRYYLGKQLLNFIWFDVVAVDKVYSDMIELVFKKEYIHESNMEPFREYLFDWITKIDEYCPYLHFYTQAFIGFMFGFYENQYSAFQNFMMPISDNDTSLCAELYMKIVITDEDLDEETNIIDELNDFLCCGDAYKFALYFDGTVKKKKDIFTLAKNIVIEDINKRREDLRSEIDFITAEKKEFAELNPMQKLYMLDFIRKQNGEQPFYTDVIFRTKYCPNVTIPKNIKNTDELKNYFLEKEIDIAEMYEIYFLDDLIKFELFKVFSNDVNIKKCKYCGHYFVPKGRIDTEYCNRINVGETKPCNEIGATKTYKESKRGNIIYQEYTSAYKKYHSRVRNGKMDKYEFFIWSENARELRDEYINLQDGFEEFKQKLDEIPIK